MNLGNRLDAHYEGEWGPVLHATDFVHVASRGFDHIRLPVRFNAHASEGLRTRSTRCFSSELTGRSIGPRERPLDHRRLPPLRRNPPEPASARDRFLGIWEQLANRYQNRPPSVVFELLNEPNGALDAYWNDFAWKAIEVVRRTNPTRLLIVDTVQWAGPTALGQLGLPPNDPNLMATIHAYDPVLFTLQGGEWAGPAFSTTGILYPGPPSVPIMPTPSALAESWVADWFQRYNSFPGDQNPSSPAQVARQLANASSYMATTGIPVYNGEWGCTEKAESRRACAGCPTSVEKPNGWAWAGPSGTTAAPSACSTPTREPGTKSSSRRFSTEAVFD